MTNDLFTGTLVRLVAPDPARLKSEWSRDSEMWQLLSSNPPMVRTTKHVRERWEKEIDPVTLRRNLAAQLEL